MAKLSVTSELFETAGHGVLKAIFGAGATAITAIEELEDRRCIDLTLTVPGCTEDERLGLTVSTARCGDEIMYRYAFAQWPKLKPTDPNDPLSQAIRELLKADEVGFGT